MRWLTILLAFSSPLFSQQSINSISNQAIGIANAATVPRVPVSVTPACASGCTFTWSYGIQERTSNGNTVVSAGVQTTVGAHVLDSSGNNQNHIQLPACKIAGDTLNLWIITTTGTGTRGLLADSLTCSGTYNDQSGVGDGTDPTAVEDDSAGVYVGGYITGMPQLLTDFAGSPGYRLYHFDSVGNLWIDAQGGSSIYFGNNGGFLPNGLMGLHGTCCEVSLENLNGDAVLTVGGFGGVTVASGNTLGLGAGTDYTTPVGTLATTGVDAGQMEINAGVNPTCNTNALSCRDIRSRHIVGSGALPIVVSGFSSGTPIVSGSDMYGSVKVGSTPGNTGVIGFGTSWTTNKPSCTAVDETSRIFVQAVPDADSLTLNGVEFSTGSLVNFNANDILSWTCGGKIGIPVGTANVFITEGDSITNPTNLSNPWKYPFQSYDGLSTKSTTVMYDLAVPGAQTSNVLERESDEGQLLNLYSALKAYSVFIGTNNLYVGDTAAATYAGIESICAGITSNVSGHVIVWTILPRSDAGTPGDFETKRQALNTLIRNGHTSPCGYTVADAGGDATIGQNGDSDNATYYIDKVHLTKAGSTIAAGYLTTALAAVGIN